MAKALPVSAFGLPQTGFLEGAPNFRLRCDPRSPVLFFVETLRFPAAWICPGSFLDLLLDPEQF